MSKNKIVILGAGYAGVHAAKMLSKKYKKNDDVEITLIDRNPYHTLMTELHEVAGGRVHPESVQVELWKIFGKTKVNLVIDNIEKVDTDNKKVTTKNGAFEYDYLMIGTGAEPVFFGVPGVKEHGFTLWSFDDAMRIRNHIQDMFAKASLERDEKKRKEMLTFIVAGSGFTGIEMAGELIEWKTKLAKDYNVDESEVTLKVVEAMGTILNMLDRKQAAKAEKYINKHGMEILKNSPIVEVTENAIILKNGDKINTKTLIWTCGIQAKQEAKEYGLETARAGRLQTNEYMQAIGKENVYVIGDVAYFEEEEGKGTPQIVEAAEQTAATAAKNIIASIDNKEMVKFKGSYHGFMVSIGGRYAVANLMGFKISGFFAMLIKHLINMVYLFGVNNINAVYNYLQHEFFAMEDKRSIFRGHISSKGNRLWLIPLRIYVGSLWVIEGLKKLLGDSGWKKLWSGKGSFFSRIEIGSDSWIKAGNVKMPFEWLQDATSAASEVVDGGETVTAYAEPILSKIPGWYSAIMEVMLPTPEMAVWMQRVVVLLEIGMGLALIVGLFTFIFAAISAVMPFNFILCAMAGWDILWYVFASIALMSGAGRTFGLDYYVMPWITKLADQFWHGKKKPIYK